MFDVQAHPGEVADVDISIDSKQVCSITLCLSKTTYQQTFSSLSLNEVQ